jgi:hypothetical protein
VLKSVFSILKTIFVFSCTSLTIKDFSRLRRPHPLKYLCLLEAYDMTEDVFPAALGQFPDLEFLQVEGLQVSYQTGNQTVTRLLVDHPK